MAIRNDLIIDWSVKPRIIIVEAPSTEITMQDTLDTLRYMESEPSAMDNSPIIDGSGKEPLDAVTKNGLTISLLDARLGFEARTEWTQCGFTGGNLVAFDGEQVKLRKITASTPVHSTDFVNVDRVSSSSGTLQEQDALQYSSYSGRVNIDVTSNNTGVEYPVGNMEYPVNNLQDAVIIAESKGFDVLEFRGTLALGVGDDISNKTIRGTNPMTSILVVTTEAITNNVYIRDCYFTGALNGGSVIRDCVLGNIQYFNGYIEHCALTTATIYINGGGVLLNCVAGATCTSDPIIDVENATSLAIRDFQGSLTLVNKVGVGACEINLNGRLTLDESMDGGQLTIFGDGYVVNNSTDNMIVVDRTTGTPQEIANAILDLDAGCL